MERRQGGQLISDIFSLRHCFLIPSVRRELVAFKRPAPGGGTGNGHDSISSMLGIYLHIPFCGAICHYCNFNRGLLDTELKARYVAALAREIEQAAEPTEPADTIFFGGGTPSLLSPAEVAHLIAACRSAFSVVPDAEVTLEANPETLTADALHGYRKAGVTRMSVGVQSFDPAELNRLGRVHSAETAHAAVPMIRAAGFDNVSLDLMMWLPGQTVTSWLNSVRRLADIGPDHASLYLLELYPNAPLREQMARRQWSQAPDDEAADMYEQGLAILDEAGYEQYEISNVARDRQRSRHNLKYWQDGAWIGFGCGAHSTRTGVRWRNVSGTMDYSTRVECGESVTAERRVMTHDERAQEALMTGLRLTEGVDLTAFEARYQMDTWARYGNELAPFVEAGVLRHQPGQRLALTRAGMLLSNEVMAVLIDGPVR